VGCVSYAPLLIEGALLRTLAGVDLRVHATPDGSIFIGDAKVIKQDVVITNGVVHVVDKVCKLAALTPLPINWTDSDSASSSLPSRPPRPLPRLPHSLSSLAPLVGLPLTACRWAGWEQWPGAFSSALPSLWEEHCS
jgi:hypothetical protein